MSDPKVSIDLAAAALEYAAAGFPVFPVGPNKIPLIKGWPANATTDQRQIQEWWAEWPEAMIGMPTGSRSGLDVVDYDQHKGLLAQEAFDRLEERCGHLPGTAVAETGRGGFHYFFRHPQRSLRTGANVLGRGIDFQGDGRFVVLAPSFGKGRPYQWRTGTILDLGTVAPLPDALADLLSKAERVPTPLKKETSTRLFGVYPSSTDSDLPLEIVERRDAKWITSVMRHPGAVQAMCGVLEICDPRKFRCVIPDHHDRRPSASVAPGESGVYMYHDHHGRSRLTYEPKPGVLAPQRVFALGEVYGFKQAGAEFPMHPPEKAMWSIRLMLAADVIVRAGVELSPLPPTATSSARAVWKGFWLLLDCRALCMPNERVPLSQHFAARWCGMSVDTAKEGIRWLRENGFLVHMGKFKLSNTFLPSDGTGIPIRSFAPVAVAVSDLRKGALV